MEAIEIIESYPWYIPSRVALWRSVGGVGVDPTTEIVVMNHPEALIESEQVDIELMMGLAAVEDPTPKRSAPVMDAISSLRMMQPQGEVKPKGSSALIDKFLEVKDLRITLPDESDGEDELVWEQVAQDQPFTPEDESVSEELARIYLNQGLYSEASDIYNRLFLLYSEKSVYFASQIENIAKILEKGDGSLKDKIIK